MNSAPVIGAGRALVPIFALGWLLTAGLVITPGRADDEGEAWAGASGSSPEQMEPLPDLAFGFPGDERRKEEKEKDRDEAEVAPGDSIDASSSAGPDSVPAPPDTTISPGRADSAAVVPTPSVGVPADSAASGISQADSVSLTPLPVDSTEVTAPAGEAPLELPGDSLGVSGASAGEPSVGPGALVLPGEEPGTGADTLGTEAVPPVPTDWDSLRRGWTDLEALVPVSEPDTARILLLPSALATAEEPFPWRPGWVWGYHPRLMPAHGALLHTRALWQVSYARLIDGGFLKPEQRIREDTLRMAVVAESLRLVNEVEPSYGAVLPDLRWTRITVPTQVQDQISVNLEQGTVEVTRSLRDTPVEPRVRFTQRQYLRRLTSRSFRQAWEQELKQGLKADAAAASRRGLVKVDLPFELPSQLQGIFGEGKPNLSVRGSERITFGGTSRWRPNEVLSEYQRGQSKFPQLDMKQELNLQLTGTIGDKVSVDVDQSSQAATPLSNRIKIRYKGYDDEIIQQVDLGNTSLNLPGTQYVSYGGKAEGLFGINAQAKMGDLDLTGILTKQEGKSDSKSVSRSAETRTVKIDDLDFVQARYFFLRDPDRCLWELDEGSLDVYVDDRIGGNDQEQGAYPGTATPGGGDSDTLYNGSFFRLQPGAPPDGDYQIQRDFYTGHPILILARPLGDQEALAATYSGWNLDANLQRADEFTTGNVSGDTLRLKMLRPSSADGTVHPTNRTKGVWGPLANLELRNIYDLGGRGILKDGFSLRIRLKGTFGDAVDPDKLGETTFLQMLGIDLSRETDTGLEPGRDDRVDDEFISYENGLLRFPDLRPFDPDSIDLGLQAIGCGDYSYYRFQRWGQGDAVHQPRPRALPSGPDSSAVFRAPAVYDSLITQNPQADSRFYLEVTYRSPVSRIQLNAFGILPGSETVTASNRILVRDRDYRIDYDIGEVEILDAANVTESDEINVTYSYIPFAGGGSQKTLAGIAAFYRPEQSKLAVSSSWLYESKGGLPGLEGRRPRLGQEPSRSVVGEFAGTYKTESRVLTRLIDAVPLLKARSNSRLDIGAGLGISLPNPNTKDKLYIDDFDGAKDVLSLTMNRRLWRPGSIPISDLLPGEILPREERDSVRAHAHGELWWYSPRNAVQERDLQPTLETREGDDSRQVLRMRFFPKGETPEDRSRSWGAVVQAMSTRGIDLSRAQFLDIWVNDFRQYRPNPDEEHRRRGKLIIDLGTVGEDAIWYRNNPTLPQDQWVVEAPNGRLDTEDFVNRDDRLDQGSEGNEDVGMDQAPSGSAGDQPFDDYSYNENDLDTDPQKYAAVNGTEGNQELDTEDLNGNDVLDRLSSYFQIAVDLSDSTLWETDVYRDYVYTNPTAPPDLVSPTNGWRRIRIPLGSDSLVSRLRDFEAADPAWEKIFHCRVWLTGFEEETLIDLGGLEITGNRWYEGGITDLRGRTLPDSARAPGEEFFVGVINNKDDAAIYTPPITTRKENDITEKEQSITLNMLNLQPGHRASIYRTYSQSQDYTLYENMEFFLNRRIESADNSELHLAIRLSRDAGSDTTNYYEYRRPVPANWELVDIDFAVLSQLQLPGVGAVDSTRGITSRELGNGVVISRRGNPTLTSVQRISFFVANLGDEPLGRGNVWIDELRLTQVKKDRGLAARFSVAADFSNLARINFNYQRTGADFLKIGQDKGSGTTTTAWNVNASTDNILGFAEYLDLSAPIRTSFNFSRRVPKFRANSDLVLETATDRDISETRADEVSFTLSRRRLNTWWERYLIAPFTLSGAHRRSINLQPTARDTTVIRTGTAGWNLDLGQFGDLTLRDSWRTKLRFLPTSLGALLSGSNMKTKRWSRTDLNRPYEEQPNQDRTTASLNLSAGLRPITPVNYRIDSMRDLMLHHNQQAIAGLNLGRETSRKQNLNVSWDLPVLRRILGPRFSWNGNSSLNLATQNSSPEGDEPDRINAFANGRTASYSGRLNLSDLYNAARDLGGGEDSTGTPRARGGGGPLTAGGLTLGVLNVTYTVTTNTSYSRRKGEPTVLYQLALSDDPGSQTTELSRANSRRSNSRTLNMDTNFRFPKSISLTTRYARTNTGAVDNGLATTGLTKKWPELDINWGQLHRVFGVGNLFTSFQASTRYSREQREQGSAQTPRDQAGMTVNWSPLLNVSATFRNGVSATLTSSRLSSTDERFRPSRSVTENARNQYGLTLKKTLNLRRQISVPLTDDVRTIQTRLDLNASIDISSQRTQTRIGSAPPSVSINRSSWQFSTGGTYQFTQTISGSGSINFGQDTDKKNEANTTRFIGISVTASFTF